MKLLKKIYLLIALIFNFLIIKTALAAEDIFSRLKRVRDVTNLPETTATPQRIIVNIIVYILGFVALFFLVSIIYAGYQWMTSAGNEEKLTKAKARLKNSIIGIFIIIAAYSITWYIGDILTRATCEGGYYCFPGRHPHPSGQCRDNDDCVFQFGERWVCNERGSCVFGG